MQQYTVLSYNDMYKADYSKYNDLIVRDTCEYDEMNGCDLREVVFNCNDVYKAHEIGEHVRNTMRQLNECDDEDFEDALNEQIEMTDCAVMDANTIGM